MIRNIRYAIRGLLRNKAFAVTAILTIGLGMGVSVAMFSVFSTVLLRRLPYSNPEQLVVIWETNMQRGANHLTVAAANFEDWRQQTHVFEGMSLVKGAEYTMTASGEHLKVTALQAQPEFFELLGSRPQLGRTFTTDESASSSSNEAVLSHALWKEAFGGRADVIGKAINLDKRLFTIIGVMPADFDFPIAKKWNLWVPLTLDAKEETDRRAHIYGAIARLRPGMRLTQAQVEMDGIAAGMAARNPSSNTGLGVRLVPIMREITGDTRAMLSALLGAVGLLLLIVCCNVAMLLLVRCAGRRGEIAVRIALGSSRRDLLAQLSVESFVLASVGGALGIMLASASIPFVRTIPVNLPRIDQVSIDWRVLIFFLLVVAVCAVLFGFAPAARLIHPEVIPILRAGSPTAVDGGGPKLLATLRAFVLVEIVLTVIILVDGGLLGASLWKLMGVDPGFNSTQVVTADVTFALVPQINSQQIVTFYSKLLQDVRQLPQVDAVGLTTNLPIGGPSWGMNVSIEGRPIRSGDLLITDQRLVSSGYFQTMRIPLILGRFFEDRDTPDAMPVAIVNEEFSRRYFPGEDPIGHRVKWGLPEDQDFPWQFTIVGVVGNVRHRELETPTSPELYMCVGQMVGGLGVMIPREITLVVRSSGSLRPLPEALRADVKQLDSQVILMNTRTLESVLSQSLASRKFNMDLFLFFGTLALILSWIGIYGATTYVVVFRKVDFGVRMALGASPNRILQAAMAMSGRLAGIGILSGLLGSWMSVRFVRSLLYGISPYSVKIFVAAALVVSTANLLATYLSARHARSIDPSAVLRGQ